MIEVGDIIRIPAITNGFRVWRVIGVYLGGLNQESLVELEVLDKHPQDYKIFVPYEILTKIKYFSV